MAEKATQELERIYTIPLRTVRASPNNHQTDRAVRHIKAYLERHMKAEEVWLDPSVNERLWARGMYHLPRRIRVRAVKFDDGVVEVSLPETEVKDSIRGEIKERREKAEKDKETKKEKKGEKTEGEEAEKGKEAAKPEPGAEAAKKPEGATKPAAEPEKAEKPASESQKEPAKAAPKSEKSDSEKPGKASPKSNKGKA